MFSFIKTSQCTTNISTTTFVKFWDQSIYALFRLAPLEKAPPRPSLIPTPPPCHICILSILSFSFSILLLLFHHLPRPHSHLSLPPTDLSCSVGTHPVSLHSNNIIHFGAIDLFMVQVFKCDKKKLKSSNTKQNGPRKTLHWSRTLPPELFVSVSSE